MACFDAHGRFASIRAWLFGGGETAVVCSWLFGARFEGCLLRSCLLFSGGETAVVCSWLFGACFEGYGRCAFVPAWLFGGGETAVQSGRTILVGNAGDHCFVHTQVTSP
jgi:hypothetical protein